jgi:O-antigen ligase
LTAVVIFSSARDKARRVRLIQGATITKLIIALIALMCIGVPFSLWQGHSAMFVLKSYFPNVVFFVLVAASVRTVRDIEWYALMNLYGALVFATVVSLFFRVGGDGRLGGLIYYDANDFALVMVSTVPFCIYFVSKGHKGSRRILALVTLSMVLTSIVKSGSRGGFIGLIAVMLYLVLFYRAIPSRVRLGVTAAGIALFLGFASAKYWTLMGTILHPSNDYNYTDNTGRVEVWKRGVGYMLHHPITGVGVAAYPQAEGQSDLAVSLLSAGKGFKWSVAHNSFLETGAELGFPGLFVFVAMFVVTTTSLRQISKRGRWAPWVSKRETALAQMLIGAFVGFAVAGFFVSAEYFAYFYFMLGLSVAMLKVIRMRAAAFPVARSKINVRLASRTPPTNEPDLSWVRNSVEASLQSAPPRR